MSIEIPEIAQRGVITTDTPALLKARISQYLVLPIDILERASPAFLSFLDGVLVTDGPRIAALIRGVEGLGNEMGTPEKLFDTAYPTLFYLPYLHGNPSLCVLRGSTPRLSFLSKLLFKGLNLIARRDPLPRALAPGIEIPDTPETPVLIFTRYDSKTYWLTAAHPSEHPEAWLRRLMLAREAFPFLANNLP